MTFTNRIKNLATWGNNVKRLLVNRFLLKEDGDFLLLETGDKIIIGRGGSWTNKIKS